MYEKLFELKVINQRFSIAKIKNLIVQKTSGFSIFISERLMIFVDLHKYMYSTHVGHLR